MTFFGKWDRSRAMLANNNNGAWAPMKILSTCWVAIGGILALLGIVAQPIQALWGYCF